MKKDKNVIDRFLSFYEENNNRKIKRVKTYYRPTKTKCIVGFGFSLLLMIILLLLGFQFNMVYIMLFVGDLIVLLYYGINLFTVNGFIIPKYVDVQDDDDKFNNYKVQ